MSCSGRRDLANVIALLAELVTITFGSASEKERVMSQFLLVTIATVMLIREAFNSLFNS